MDGAAEVVVLPRVGTVLADARGADRALRVSWHAQAGVVVLSMWRDDRCVGTLRLPAHEVPTLVSALVEGLAQAAPTVGSGGTPAASLQSHTG